jgi:cell wall-associated NlpC family hydrolase
MVITDSAAAQFKQHVLAEYPREACGVIVNDIFVKCQNVAPTPTQTFQISATELAGIGAQYGKVQAILHSHPFDRTQHQKWEPSWPSHEDMKQWLKSDAAWGIVATEGENISEMLWLDEGTIAPLEGRPFVHGVWDCYSTVRDWFRLERGITLKNYPRAMGWWERGLDHYSTNFADAGFEEVPRAIADVGDICLFQVRSQVINHAAVITGSNQLVQHLFHRLSGYDRFDRWERMIVKYIRLKPC